MGKLYKNALKAFIIGAAIILAIGAIGMLLSSCGSSDGRRVMDKYYVEESYAQPKDCQIGVDVPCLSIRITHYYLVVGRCAAEGNCRTEFIEVSKETYDRQEIE